MTTWNERQNRPSAIAAETARAAAAAERPWLSSRTLMLLFGAVASSLALVGLGVGHNLSIGVVMWLPLVALSAWLCGRLDRDDRLGLVGIFFAGLTARWLACSLVQLLVYNTRPGLFAPDEISYDVFARIVSEAMSGHLPLPPELESLPGLVRLNAYIYYFLGYGILAPKLLVGIAGAWTGVFTALIASFIVPDRAARRAGFLAALFPSLVLWSSVILKDTWTLLGNELALFGFLSMRERARPTAALLFVAGLALIAVNRPYGVVFALATVPLSLLMPAQRRRPVRDLLVLGAVLMVALFVVRTANPLAVFTDDEAKGLDQVSVIRLAYTVDVGSAVNTSAVDTSTPLGLALWVPLGLAYFFLAPIPFTGTSLLSLSTSPEMMLWYWFLPSLWRGVRDAARSVGRRTFMPLAIYVVISSASWAVVVTNVGSLYRYRAQVTFVLLTFIAADQVRRRERREAEARARWIAPRPRALLPDGDPLAPHPGGG